MEDNKNNLKKAWVVTVDMGYGHQRTAYSLRDIAFGGRVININNYKGIPKKDKKIWKTARSFYEFVSRFKRVPIIGNVAFSILDKFQKIITYYPRRDMSSPNFSLKNIFYFIKKGWGRDLIEKLEKNPLPLVSTFFTPAFMAEEFKYKNDIYCVICDADIARSWVSLNPHNSRIKYFASTSWSRDRLKLYGVKPENIIFTGYPLPKENIGSENMEILKKDLAFRLLNLDPSGKYCKTYKPLIRGYLGELPEKPNHPLTIMFSMGGAGAQKEIGLALVNSLKAKIKEKRIKVIFSVGIKEELQKYFEDNIKGLKLDGWVQVIYGKDISEYFGKFNQALRTTDILWTKPSELSFYSALGIPIIIAPPVGSQEDFNKKWLLHIGSATNQENPEHTDEWLFDLLHAGDFAEMAMQGFIEIKSLGTYNIEHIIKNESSSSMLE